MSCKSYVIIREHIKQAKLNLFLVLLGPSYFLFFCLFFSLLFFFFGGTGSLTAQPYFNPSFSMETSLHIFESQPSSLILVRFTESHTLHMQQR